MFRSPTLVCFLVVVLSCLSVFVRGQDAKNPMQDIQLGMQGLAQAGNDPAVLAQLLQDMQNPEIMAEARKMMADPEFQKQMKKLQESEEFKESLKKTKEMLNDPNEAAKAEAKMEVMAKVGAETLKKGAAAGMEQAMDALKNPEVRAEMEKLIKEPGFRSQLEQLKKNPEFKMYVDAMQDMMKDPATRSKVEALKASI